MANAHSKSFFGQTTGLIVSSSSKEDDFIFLKCVKKKGDGTWEKLSLGEGKTIKCSLDEMVMMLQVLERKISNWNTYHAYKDANTQINFNRKEEGGKEIVWIKIGGYSKMLAFPQVEILKMLLAHLLKEKIEHATSGKPYRDNSATSEGNNDAKTRSNSRPVGGVVKNISSVPSDKTQQEKTLARTIGGGGLILGLSSNLIRTFFCLNSKYPP